MVLRSLIVLVIVGASGLYARDLAAKRAYTERIPDLASIPRAFDTWRSEDYPLSDQVARVLGANAYVQRRYLAADGREVWLFVAYFAQQTVNAQIHSPRHCVPGSGWEIITVEDAVLHPPGRTQPASRMLIARQGLEQELYYWFRTRGGVVTGEYALKWDLLENSLARRPTDAAFVRFSAARADSNALQEVLAQVDRPLDQVLGEVGLR